MTVRLLLFLITLTASIHFAQASTLVPVDQAFDFSLFRAGPGRYVLTAQVMPGFALYRDTVVLRSSDRTLRAPLPAGQVLEDPVLGDRRVLSGNVQIPLTLDPGGADATLTVRFQGCQVDVLCYPPQTLRFGLGAK